MKNIIIILMLFCLSACDPGYCLTAFFENKTGKDITLYFISHEYIRKAIDDETTIDSLHIEKEGAHKQYGCSLGSFIPSDFSYDFYDSILIKERNSGVLKTYYPNSTGKNIYDTENRDVWKLNKAGKDDYEFTFEITQEDISPE